MKPGSERGGYAGNDRRVEPKEKPSQRGSNGALNDNAVKAHRVRCLKGRIRTDEVHGSLR